MIWCGINNSASLRYIALSKRARTHTHTYMYAPHTHTHTYAHARTCTRTCAHRLALLHTIADDSVSGLSRFPATVDMDDLVKWLMSVRYRQLRSAMLALLPGTEVVPPPLPPPPPPLAHATSSEEVLDGVDPGLTDAVLTALKLLEGTRANASMELGVLGKPEHIHSCRMHTTTHKPQTHERMHIRVCTHARRARRDSSIHGGREK